MDSKILSEFSRFSDFSHRRKNLPPLPRGKIFRSMSKVSPKLFAPIDESEEIEGSSQRAKVPKGASLMISEEIFFGYESSSSTCSVMPPNSKYSRQEVAKVFQKAKAFLLRKSSLQVDNKRDYQRKGFELAKSKINNEVNSKLEGLLKQHGRNVFENIIKKRKSWDFVYENAFDAIQDQLQKLKVPRMYSVCDIGLTVFRDFSGIQQEIENCHGTNEVAYQHCTLNDISPSAQRVVLRSTFIRSDTEEYIPS